MNIVDLLKSQLGGAVAGQIGKQIGVDESTAKTGLEALIPTVLGGLLKQSSDPAGAESLNQTLDSNDFDGSLLDQLPGMLSGGDTSAMSSLGGNLVKNLFGDKIGAIVGLLSGFTKMDGNKLTSLLGLVAPVVMSFLGKQKREQGLDASGLASMLASQKSNIASSMPSGLGAAMGFADLDMSSAAPAIQAVQSQAKKGLSGLTKSILGLGVLGIIGVGAWWAYNIIAPGMGMKGVKDVAPVAVDENVDLSDFVNEDPAFQANQQVIRLGGEVQTLFGDLTSSLRGVTDEATATAAVEKLETIGTAFDGIKGKTEGFSAVQNEAIAEWIEPLSKALQPVIDKVTAIPGVGAILQPVIDSLMEKIASIGAA